MIHAREDYNRIQDPLNKIGKKEPVFLIRAQDVTMVPMLLHWVQLQREQANCDEEACRKVLAHIQPTMEWQRLHGCKTADLPK
jgi:hypothetical protein